MRPPIPILRSFDEHKAREFWVDFLGLRVEFEHRFEPDAPLYMGLRRGDLVVHLSEHHGDASPGASLRVEVADVDALRAELLAKGYRYARPGVQDQPWGTRDMTIGDPFGNRVTFYTALKRS